MRSTRRRLCSAIVVGAFVCMPVRGTAKADQNSLSVFTEALKHDGFDVTPGAVEVWNMAADWCAGNPDVEHAWYTNNAPYLRLMVPESAGIRHRCRISSSLVTKPSC